ncbi:MAG: ABC transporter permease [Myxococcales bacterium]|nr:ABC transporter permease [Myxococcales bacterium]
MKGVVSLAKMVMRALAAGMTVALIAWMLVECAPGSSAQRAAVASGAIAPGDTHTSSAVRASLVSQVAKELELDAPAFVRLPRRALGAVTMDFGQSWRDGAPVAERLVSAAGAKTLLLCLSALLLSCALACLGAPRSARHPRSPFHKIQAAVAAFVLSMPIPWLAMLALDSLSHGHPFAFAPKGGLQSVAGGVLPILVLAAAPSAVLWRHLQERLQSEARAHWVVAARARGVDESALWNRQLLKASLPTVFSLVPVMFAYILAASVVVEQVFAIAGFGSMVARAASIGDAPVLIAFASTSAIAISLATQGMHRLTLRVDPRREVGT